MRYANVLALIPVLILGAASTLSQAAVDINVAVNLAPPPIPVYDQPPLPAAGYLWTPGYWAWDGMDYYWVPGTWVQPPSSGMLWTPGYWGWRGGSYLWNAGYWGPEVGFYGGIDYGYGYGGSGYQGGYWHGGAFFYNRSVANFGRVNIVNVYSAPARHWGSSHVSFNGGEGGVRAQPTAHDRMAMGEHHAGLTSQQANHREQAQGMRELHASQNGGRPQILTTARAADFAHPGPGLHNHQTPRSNGGGPQPGRGAAMHAAPPRPEDAAGQRFQPHEQVQRQPQVQHQPQVRGPQVSHEQQARPEARPQASHEKERRDSGEQHDR
ncbi:MAG TPA: YXWGXW repeat-containing protein [Steroidobacteraceae bacterium]